MSRPFVGLRIQEDGPRWIHSIWNVPLERRLERALRRHAPDVVLVYRGERLNPAAISNLRHLSKARRVNWFPEDPHLLELSLRLAPAYDAFFTHDSYRAAQHRAQTGGVHETGSCLEDGARYGGSCARARRAHLGASSSHPPLHRALAKHPC